jgi:thiosulfate/3-mercaptopyruvate sulfurtransferase
MNIAIKLVLTLMLSFAGTIHAKTMMVDTQWLHEHMNDADVVLVDMSSDATQYQRFHIPGAVYLGYGNLVQKRKKDKVSLRIPDERLYKILGILGISRQSHVVIYDDMGGLNAGRFYWELERIGHPRVSIVDGGLVKWILEGRKVDNKNVTRKPVQYAAADKIYTNDIDLAGVRKVLESGTYTLLDVRSKEEYVGHPKFKRTGHIPGAYLWSWDDSVAFDKGFVLKPEAQLQQSLASIGIKDKSQPLLLYCNSGHRASQTYMTLKHLGYKNIKLYDGSMAEYTRDKQAPIKQGTKP